MGYHRQIFKTAVSNSILQDPRQRRLFSKMDLMKLFSLKCEEDCKINVPQHQIMASRTTSKGQIKQSININEDNGNTLSELFLGKGITGVFDHDVLDKPYLEKSLVERDVECIAKRIAKKSAKILQESSDRLLEGRVSDFQHTPISGADILKKIQMRKDTLQTQTQQHIQEKSTEKQQLSIQIRSYLRDFPFQGPTTPEIMEYFSKNVQANESFFRKTLKSIATIQNGTWLLKLSQ